MKVNHAVLASPNMLMWLECKSVRSETLAEPCYTLADLAEVAYTRYVTHLWVYPGYGDFQAIKALGDWQFSPYENRKKAMMGAIARKRGHRDPDVDIIFPQHTSWWGTDRAPGWLRDADPREVLIVLCYLELALGVTVTGSPGRTGWNYLKKLHPEWIEDVGIDLAACHFDRKAAADLIWQRLLKPSERTGLKFIHKLDKGSAYPYAASKTDIGVGTPEHLDYGDIRALAMNDKQAVGVWRCTVKLQAQTWMSEGDPKGDWKDGEGWLAGPVIRQLRYAGHDVTIHEGWVFPEQHDVMVLWANNLWKIRQGFADTAKWLNRKCATLAQRATKQIANTTIGITAFKGFDADDEMKRPDIRIQIIARHRELTWHNIQKLFTERDLTPVIVYMDAVYYVSSSPDAHMTFPELLKREGQLGGYRWEGCIELTPEVLAMFDTNMGEAERLEYLNKKGWQK